MIIYAPFLHQSLWRSIQGIVMLGLVQSLVFGQPEIGGGSNALSLSPVAPPVSSLPAGPGFDSYRALDGPLITPRPYGFQLALAGNTRLPRANDTQPYWKSLDAQVREAEAQYAQGQKEAALRIWQAILRMDPAHRRSLYDLATARMNARQFIEAEQAYDRLIRADSPIRLYPQAWFLAAWAHHRQYQTLTRVHEEYLARYLRSDDPTYLDPARKLLQIARDKTVSVSLDEARKADLLHKLAGSERSIIHFWAEWCGPCLRELSALFEFSRDHPGVNTVIVAEESEKEWADRQLNELFAPFKESRSENLVFIFDGKRELWSRFVPLQDQSLLTVPRTVFLEGLTRVRYVASPVDWSQMDPASAWSQSK